MWADDTGSPAVRVTRDLRRQHIGAGLMAVAGLVVAAALLPRGDELLLIYVRGRNLSDARNFVTNRAAEGVSTVSSVVAHGELSLFEGRVDEAVSDLEAYVESHPDDPQAWKRLARLYSHAQRLQDQVRAAAELHRLQPTPDTARQLAAFYRWTGDDGAEVAALQDLIRLGSATSDEYLRSARIDAARGELNRAVDTLSTLVSRDAAAFDFPSVELLSVLEAERERTAEGGPTSSRLGRWVQTMPIMRERPDLFLRLASTLRQRGHATAALAVVELPRDPGVAPGLLAARARVAMGTDVSGAVVDELSARDAQTPLQNEPLDALVQLALSAGRYDAVATVLARSPARRQSALAAMSIGHAVAHKAQADAQALIAQLGDHSLHESPLLALELAVARRDRVGIDSWIARIDARATAAGPEQMTAVAELEAKAGLEDRAIRRLVSVVASGRAPSWAYYSLATMASGGSDAEAVLTALDVQGVRSPDARRAWAGLAARTGRFDLLETWAHTSPDERSTSEVAREVFFLLADAGRRTAAVAAAERAAAISGAVEDKLLLGQALLAAGRPHDAVASLRVAQPTGVAAETAYEAALAQAYASGADVGAELRAVFASRLSTPALSDDLSADRRAMLVEALWAAGERTSIYPEVARLADVDLDRWLSPLVESARAAGRTGSAATRVAAELDRDPRAGTIDLSRRETLTRALLDLEAPDAALLPHLQRLADEAGGTWIHVYDEQLARASLTAPRIALWSQVGASTVVAPDDRRAAASRLVELGAPQAAARVLQPLVSDAGPEDPDVLQLISLWQSTASPETEPWLTGRARAASVRDQAVWFGHMMSVGAAHLVRRVAPSLPVGADPPYARVWMESIRAEGDRGHTRRALAEVSSAFEHNPDVLRFVARVALAEGETTTATETFARLLREEPADREAQRWLGTLAFYEGKSRAALDHLTAYERGGGDEAEPLFQLGELNRGLGDHDAARALYQRALKGLTSPAADASPSVLRANTLSRLGERERARAEFSQALAADSGNHHLRADYVVALLEWGRLDDAEQVLTATPPAAIHGDGSGERRLQLLGAQVDDARGRFERAFARLEALRARFPDDPDVLVAHGGADAGRGRLLQADATYATAAHSAPFREDIARLVRQRAQAQTPRASVATQARAISDAWTAGTTSVSLQSGTGRRASVTVVGERQQVRADQAMRADGSVAPLHATLSRFEATIATAPTASGRATVSLFGADGGLGGGASAERHDLRGATSVSAEYGRPFWDFLESAADGGRRDRLAVQRGWRFTPSRALWAVAGWNRYRLASGARTTSATATFGIIQTVRPTSPTLTLQYGLDIERRLAATEVARADGSTATPIPLVSREVHVFGAVTRTNVAKLGEVDASLGYTIDRLGGRGSFLTARLTPFPYARVGVELWGERRRFVLATAQQATDIGARLVVGF